MRIANTYIWRLSTRSFKSPKYFARHLAENGAALIRRFSIRGFSLDYLCKVNIYCSDTAVDFYAVLTRAVYGIISHTFSFNFGFADAFINFYLIVLTAS